MNFSIHPLNLIRALSLALELSSGGLSRHHWRTAMIASQLARYIGLDDQAHPILVYAALLHDIGAASNWEEQKKLNVWDPGEDAYHHAEFGYQLLDRCAPLQILAEPVRHHHDRWDGANPSGLVGNRIPLLSRMINLADRMEILVRDDLNVAEQQINILEMVGKASGSIFDPDLVKALFDLAKHESFWLDLTNSDYYHNSFQTIYTYGRVNFGMEDILAIGEIFATIIDCTSRFTAIHSHSVAAVAAFLAEAEGYCEDEIKIMRISGLFHDLGKLAVPNQILEKPGKLSAGEFFLIKKHPYYTYRILEQIDGFDLIAEWAAYHHETLDGTGYPFGMKDQSLRRGSRITAVADVFVALTEDRPYRVGMKQLQAEKIMRQMAHRGKIDGRLVSLLFTHGDVAYSLVHQQAAFSGSCHNLHFPGRTASLDNPCTTG